jgi:hypothetical protein
MQLEAASKFSVGSRHQSGAAVAGLPVRATLSYHADSLGHPTPRHEDLGGQPAAEAAFEAPHDDKVTIPGIAIPQRGSCRIKLGGVAVYRASSIVNAIA